MQRVVLSLAAACALAIAPALAAEDAPVTDTKPSVHQGWGLRVGYLQGHEVAKGPPDEPVLIGLDGTVPTMKDTATIGGFYFNDASPHVRIELGVSLAPTKIDNVCPDADPLSSDPGTSCREHVGSVKTLLLYWDLIVMPHWKWGKTHFGVPISLGWANARASEKYAPQGTVNQHNQSLDFSAGAGMTYGIGLRPYWDIGKDSQLFVQARAMRFHRLVNVSATTVKSLEVTVGMSFGAHGK